MSYIQTVVGRLSPIQTGIALIHEHVLFDLTCLYSTPAPSDAHQTDSRVSLSSLGWIRTHAYNSRDNLYLQDTSVATAELVRFKRAGGGLIADVSSASIGRNPEGLRQVSKASGIPIVMGCGHYVASSHPPRVKSANVDEVADEMSRDITIGVNGTGIRAGVIGEIGLSAPAHPDEVKCLQAAAVAQERTGAAIIVHSPGGHDGPFHVADLLENAGADPSRVVVSHLDARFWSDISSYTRLASRGFNLGVDTFGRDIYIDFLKTQLPSDTSRIEVVKSLCDLGLQGQVVLSQDICLKMELSSFGGHGHGHILENLWGRLIDAGITQEDLEHMLTTNPQRLLTMPDDPGTRTG